jgi:hypothetical protein
MPLPAHGAGRESELGVGGDVVALVGARRALRVRALAAALEQAGRVAAPVGEHARAAHHARLLRRGERDADDLDAEVRVVGAALGRVAVAAGELRGRARRARARHVHVQVGRVVGRGHERVRVRAAAGLYRGHLARARDVADVEDAHAAEARGARRFGHGLGAAVDAPARLLDRQEEQVAHDRHVALPAGQAKPVRSTGCFGSARSQTCTPL